MNLRAVDSQRSFYHTDYLAGNLFGPANRYRLFREKIWPKLLELAPKLEALYCAENGRPPIDPVLLCGVTLLQFMEKVADRRASEQVVYHLGWKSWIWNWMTTGFIPRCWFIFATGWKRKKPSG